MLKIARVCKSTPIAIWDGSLKDRFLKGFKEQSIINTQTRVAYLPIAKFVSLLYELQVVDRQTWPTSRIIEDMHYRGYAKDVFTKPSYGAEPPAPLSMDECLKWMAYYRVVGINEYGK